jgi:predicted DsbA family dithiol-disulfide isomerase
MYESLFAHQDSLGSGDLYRYADELGLDMERFSEELRAGVHAPRVARDVDGADQSGVAGTPTFFVNGYRYHGAFDIGTLTLLVRSTLAQSMGRRQVAAHAADAMGSIDQEAADMQEQINTYRDLTGAR